MKTILVCQIGEIVADQCRVLQLEVPEDMDVAVFDKYPTCLLLEKLANEARIAWEEDDWYGTFANRCFVVSDKVDPDKLKEDPVLHISHDMLQTSCSDEMIAVKEASDIMRHILKRRAVDIARTKAGLQKAAVAGESTKAPEES